MGNIIIIMALIFIVSIALYGTVKRIRFGSSCCGTKTPPEKKVKVRDKNIANYPYKYILHVDGMHCSNCARRVENAINKSGDNWAHVNLGRKRAEVLSKTEKTEDDFTKALKGTDYKVTGFEQIEK